MKKKKRKIEGRKTKKSFNKINCFIVAEIIDVFL